MGPSSLNIHFWWVGVLGFFVSVNLRFTMVSLKVDIRLAKIDFLAFEMHSILHTLESITSSESHDNAKQINILQPDVNF